MDVIITYDIKRNHTAIKDELKSLDYRDAISGVSLSNNTAVVQQLPNTTLIKYAAVSTKSCIDQVVAVIKKHDGGLDRIFCAQLAANFDWNGQ